MAKKYYAVKVGRTTGIYQTWADCKAQVDGFKGAKFKSFPSEKEAEAFLTDGEQKQVSVNAEGIPVTDEKTAVAYVDGSYNIHTKDCSYGVVMFHNQKQLTMSEKIETSDLNEMRNVAGEIKGSEAAMRYAVEHQVTDLTIYHDYEGIASWCLGHWKTNKEGTIAYKQYYDSIKDKVNIHFVKVKGHSGDRWNDMADELAKAAIF